MNVSAVCPLFCFSRQEQEGKCTNFVRVTALSVGIIATLAGVMTFSAVAGMHSLGIVGGSLFLAFGVTFMLASCLRFVKKEPSNLAFHDTTCLDPKSLDWSLNEIIYELYENDLEGKVRECSIDRLRDIMTILKRHGNLRFLNFLPTSDFLLPEMTPLQYWAGKGDLSAVQLLVEHGAMDYFKECPRSALFLAALNGHIDVVNYLLQNGAQATIAFFGNTMNFFIPTLLFDLSQLFQIEILGRSNEMIRCLGAIFLNLQKKDPKNLNLQFQVPIQYDDECHSAAYDWVSRNFCCLNEPLPIQGRLCELLRSFGADKVPCLSSEDLKSKGYSIGSGFSLHTISVFKNSKSIESASGLIDSNTDN